MCCSGSSPGEPKTTSCTHCCRGTGGRQPPSPQPSHQYDNLTCRLIIVSISHGRGSGVPVTEKRDTAWPSSWRSRPKGIHPQEIALAPDRPCRKGCVGVGRSHDRL